MDTQYVVWNEATGYNSEELEKAKKIIEQDGLVAFPTETVYGLGGDALKEDAARKIYAAKGRPSDNPLIVHIARFSQLKPLVASIPPEAEILMKKFWPGPLTLIFPKSDLVPYGTTGGLDTVAIRMPSHQGAHAFLEAVGVPIAAPSANTSGRPSPTKACHVKEDLDGKIDMIIDGGQVGLGLESTIVDLTDKNPVILRPGYITEEMIREVIKNIEVDKGIVADAKVHPKAPGMKYRHYAPKAEMTVFQGETKDVIAYINQLVSEKNSKDVGILATEETKDCYPVGTVICVGSRTKHTVARELFGALREFDHKGVQWIYSESFEKEQFGDAIMNRLRKAAGQRVVEVPKMKG